MDKRIYIVALCLLTLSGCRQSSTPKTADNIVAQAIISTEELKKDSLQKLKEMEQEEALTEFNSRSLITQDEAEIIGLVIQRWVNFHKIDITQARSSGEHALISIGPTTRRQAFITANLLRKKILRTG